MEIFKPLSPIPAYSRGNSSPCIELCLASSGTNTPNQDYGNLVNKYIIIPDDILTTKFDVLKIDDVFILRNVVCYIFKTFFERMNYQRINPVCLKGFVKDVSEKYNNVPYHNFYHATHVLHMTYVLLDKCEMFNKMSPDVLFSTLVSALVHDIGHPGNNNSYEINTCSELAYRYNDLSVLEQYHCTLAFELIKKHQLFLNYTHEEFVVCRKTIISAILGTDLANHNTALELLKMKKESGFYFETIEEQYFMAKILVHAVDIGNPIQDFEKCQAWSRRVSLEVYSQTEKEKERGLKPFTSFNINSRTSFYQHEIKYIRYICKPYWETLSQLFESLKPLYEQIVQNLDTYILLENEAEKVEVNLAEF